MEIIDIVLVGLLGIIIGITFSKGSERYLIKALRELVDAYRSLTKQQRISLAVANKKYEDYKSFIVEQAMKNLKRVAEEWEVEKDASGESKILKMEGDRDEIT